MKLIPIISVLVLFSSNLLAQDDKWNVPESANKLKNPIVLSEEVFLVGKNLFLENCAVCHGEVGKGDGEAAGNLEVKPANFSSNVLLKQSDGALFWKITTGKSPMVTFKGALNDEEIWHVIHYIKSLSEPEDNN